MQVIQLNKEPNINAKYKAYPYQDHAVKSVCDLEYAAIFHEQGLGKSKIAIDIVLYWLEKKYVDTVLIIAKKNLIHNWLRELKTHTHLKPKVLTQNRKTNYYVFNSPNRLILAHYEAIKTETRRFNLFLKTRPVAVVLDESTKIKNPNSALTKTFFELSSLFNKRIIMTGLPVSNRPYDIWSQIYFLDHGKSLGDNFAKFKKYTDLSYALGSSVHKQDEYEQKLSEIFHRIEPFTVRETKKSGVIKLPDKQFENILTSWEPRQLDLYRQVRDNLRAVIVQQGLPKEDDAEDVLKRLLRLVQIASNPKLIDDSYFNEPGKFPYLNDLVAKIYKKGEKCIVWTTFIKNADDISKALKSYGVCKVHGKLGIDDRARILDQFMTDKDKTVLVATYGTAKEGLTLTVANHAIFYDRSFSLDDYLQSQDRIHRISQSKTCYVYNLIMEDSVDQWIDALLRVKELSAQLVHGDISREYFHSIISYDLADILKDILNIK